MLKLYLGDEEDGVQNSTIPVRWCVDKETLDKLKNDGVKNPHILLVIKSGCSEMTRQLAPLGQLIEYVQFQRPGINKIYAAIVWADSGKLNDLWKVYMRKTEYGSYANSIFDYDGNFLKDQRRIELTDYKVEIPRELFAKEYPGWLKRWVNLWFEGQARDQCFFRRRAMVAFSIQPVLVLLYLIFLTVSRILISTFLLSCGFKKINIKPIFHPWDDNTNDIWWDIKHEGGFLNNHIFENAGYLLPLTPIFPAVLVGGHIVHQLGSTGYQGFMVAVYFAIKCAIDLTLFFVAISLIAIIAPFVASLFVKLSKMKTIIVITKLCGYLLEKYVADPLAKLIDKLPLPQIKEKKVLENPEIIYKQIDTDQLLICNGDKSASIDILPPQKRTIHLRFQNLKAKVCRPLAK